MKQLFLWGFAALSLSICTVSALAQDGGIENAVQEVMSRGEIHGNFQTDVQWYQEDTVIGAAPVPEQALMNGFANFIYTNGPFQAGIRYESYLNALQGFPLGYRGSGIPYRYVSYTKDKLSLTVGNFYEQFGQGQAFRAYEERGLGYDNAMDGFRLVYQPVDGLTLKGVIGKQRLFFTTGPGIVRGFDVDVSLNELFADKLGDKKTRVFLGGNFVSKYQEDLSSQYALPENVATGGGRATIINGGFNFTGEYVYKVPDPSADNGFIYRPGEALLLQGAYSTKGFGISLAAKRTDNMSFRSDRNEALTNLLINYLPALTRQHTYNLLATLYPYGTQPNGEMAYQAELVYKVPKKSLLGGKYGMGILINFSQVNNIDTVLLNDLGDNEPRKGYTSDFLEFGEDEYFRDLNIEITKKFSKQVKGIFTYANLLYNKDVIEGKSGYGIINAHVGIADVTYKIKKKHALRTEAQLLKTQQDEGDWATLILEYTIAPHWFFSVMDQYNYGNPKDNKQVHYYFASTGYNSGGNRFSIGFGRQRAGIFCVGGVCRNVPAANGVTVSVTSSF